mgnify:CR=1 FL=1
MKEKILKGFGKYIIFFVVVFVLSIITISGVSKNKKIKITDTLFDYGINNGFIDLKYSRTAFNEEEQDYDTTNITYKTYFDKNYKEENTLAIDGSLGLELESSQIGVYLPIQVVFNDDILFSTEVDEVYQTIIEIPDNNTMLHAKVRPILSDLGSDYKDLDITSLQEDFTKGIILYLRNNKNSFYYTPSKEQFYIFTKGVGRFTKNLTEEDFKNFDSYLKSVCGEDSLNYKILQNISKLSGDYTLYLYVNNNQIYRIEMFNKKVSLEIELKYLNYNKELSIPDNFDEYGLDFNEYLETHESNLLSLFGLNKDGSTNLKSLLQKHFKELISYMYLCIEYSEAGDSINSQNYITLMNGLISSIEEQEDTLRDSDKELFLRYIDVYKLLRQYTVIYNKECFSSSEEEVNEWETQLILTVEELSDKLKDLGIDILADFSEVGMIKEEYLENMDDALESENSIVESSEEFNEESEEATTDNNEVEIISNTDN